MASGFSPEAEAAFRRLLNLDPNFSAREDLRRAGVAPAAIASLYPIAFADLAPALIDHLDSLGIAHLFNRVPTKSMNLHSSEASSLLPEELLAERRYEIMVDPGWVSVKAHLRSTWTQQHGKLNPASSSFSHAALLWTAHWFMSNPQLLPQRAKDSASKLMVEVDRAWRLPVAPDR